MKGDRKLMKLSAQDGKFLYEGYIRTDERTKQSLYDGAGYLFNNETKCFFNGTWANNEKVCGIETFPNGDVFEGSYSEGKFQGLGLIYNGKYRYEGQFESGRKHGQGKEEYILGGFYEGYFKDGLKHGEGKLTFADQSHYMGDFQKGLPNGFGLHVAYSKQRIVSVFPLKKKVVKKVDQGSLDDSEIQSNDMSMSQLPVGKLDEIQQSNCEYYYEGDFVDGYKHGIGRLYEPSGSYFYGYWEYNKPVRKIIYYNADEHNWKIIEVQEMVEIMDIDFYEILQNSDWKKQPTNASGYPDYKLDAYKSLIDEKGLKREHLEDPDFDFSEAAIMIKDENGTPTIAPTDYRRIHDLEIYKKINFKLFQGEIQHGSLFHSDQYSCQQLTCVLDALTYHSFLLSKVFSRKYDTDIGFFTLKFFIRNEWKEIIIDDSVPVFKNTLKPIFSNNSNCDLGWVLIFKGKLISPHSIQAFAKLHQHFTYFELCKTQEAENLLNLLTGMPCKTISLVQYFSETDEAHKEEDKKVAYIQPFSKKINKMWRCLSEKHQRTSVRICYLRKEKSLKYIIPPNYAYHLVDMQVAQQSKVGEEDRFILMKSMLPQNTLKTDTNDPYLQTALEKYQLQAINKLRERNTQAQDNPRFFIIGYEEFIDFFDSIVILGATKYTIHNNLEIVPKEADKYNNEIRMFTKFCVNLPSSLLITVTQAHISEQLNEHGEPLISDVYLPIRIVLAKEKDLYTNKSQIKKSVTKTWQNFQQNNANLEIKTELVSTLFSKSQPAKSAVQVEQTEGFQRKKNVKSKPFRYVFGRGQQKNRQISKEIALESGLYILFIQVEGSDGKKAYYPFEKLKFNLSLFSQSLLQIEKIPTINQFQKTVYETAILNAEKYLINEGKEPKFFSKVDLSERENGSSDLIIMQYFLKNEGTYLQYLRNKSTNKIWRQKLYFRVENMIILDQTDATKVDLQLNTSDRRTELVVIQQISANPYNLEGGEGICIIDIQNDRKDGDEEDDDDIHHSHQDEEHDDHAQSPVKQPDFGDVIKFK